jgi:hypothetical protein
MRALFTVGNESSKVAILISNCVRSESTKLCFQFSQVLVVFERFHIRFTAVTDGWYRTNKLQKVWAADKL